MSFDLKDFFKSGHRAADALCLGIESERFCLNLDGSAVQYSDSEGIAAIMEMLQQISGWKAKYEGPNVMSLHAADGRAITLEPGGQIEFGTSPQSTLCALESEIQHFQQMLAKVSEAFNKQFSCVGVHPSAEPDQIERLPKSRYDILEPHLQQADELGIHMMKTTAGVQINFDHTDAADAMFKLRSVFALSPVIQAMFANSPKHGFKSWRGHVWTKTDNARCGIVESLVAENSTLDDYIEYMLDVPMLFVERNGGFVDMRNKSFRDYYAAGEATAADWELHLSTPFPEVRFRPQIELRCADAVSDELALSLAALVKLVFYNHQALQGLQILVLLILYHPLSSNMLLL
ncbi:MAG: glutamate-cysteine ligase family protein [Planctomycetota bacterium]|nr:glutamate-cysteine ligase family protein [Planctomycetota bacterium]